MDPEGFAHNIDMQFYEPAPDLKPFVAHYFIARYNLGENNTYEASDILTRPDIHMVFTTSRASIVGMVTSRRSLHLEGKGVYAGIRFTSAGFYPFWGKSMSDLVDRTFPITETFPEFDQPSVMQLLAKNDGAIIKDFDMLLLSRKPKDHSKIQLIDSIIDAIEGNPAFTTISVVANAFKLNERTLQQLFKTYVGVGVKWVIMRIRFLHAVSLVHNADRPNWTRIAAELDYSTQSHFNNDFKKIMGQTPNAYVQSIATGTRRN